MIHLLTWKLQDDPYWFSSHSPSWFLFWLWFSTWLMFPNRPPSGLKSCKDCVSTTTLGYSIAALWLFITCLTQTTVSWPKSWSKARCWKSSQWLARLRTIPSDRRPLMWHAHALSKLWTLGSSNPLPAIPEMLATGKQKSSSSRHYNSLCWRQTFRHLFFQNNFHIKDILT